MHGVNIKILYVCYTRILFLINQYSSIIFVANLMYLCYKAFLFLRGFTELPFWRYALDQWNYTTKIYSITKIFAPVIFNTVEWIKVITYDLIRARNYDDSVCIVTGLHTR